MVGGAEEGEGAPAVAEIEEPGGTRVFLRITPDVRCCQPEAFDGVDIQFPVPEAPLSGWDVLIVDPFEFADCRQSPARRASQLQTLTISLC